MRKLFTERTRIVIYLEKSDELRMTAKAKENGELLAEWARNVLRNELTISPADEPVPARRHNTPSGTRRRPRVVGLHLRTEADDAASRDQAGASGHDAGNGPTAIRHTAESNWRTCLCGTCGDKRKAIYGISDPLKI